MHGWACAGRVLGVYYVRMCMPDYLYALPFTSPDASPDLASLCRLYASFFLYLHLHLHLHFHLHFHLPHSSPKMQTRRQANSHVDAVPGVLCWVGRALVGFRPSIFVRNDSGWTTYAMLCYAMRLMLCYGLVVCLLRYCYLSRLWLRLWLRLWVS